MSRFNFEKLEKVDITEESQRDYIINLNSKIIKNLVKRRNDLAVQFRKAPATANHYIIVDNLVKIDRELLLYSLNPQSFEFSADALYNHGDVIVALMRQYVAILEQELGCVRDGNIIEKRIAGFDMQDERKISTLTIAEFKSLMNNCIVQTLTEQLKTEVKVNIADEVRTVFKDIFKLLQESGTVSVTFEEEELEPDIVNIINGLSSIVEDDTLDTSEDKAQIEVDEIGNLINTYNTLAKGLSIPSEMGEIIEEYVNELEERASFIYIDNSLVVLTAFGDIPEIRRILNSMIDCIVGILFLDKCNRSINKCFLVSGDTKVAVHGLTDGTLHLTDLDDIQIEGNIEVLVDKLTFVSLQYFLINPHSCNFTDLVEKELLLRSYGKEITY